MKSEHLEVVRGSGNVFRDLAKDNADVKQFKALLAAAIIKTLDRDRLSVRKAHARTGIAAADFSGFATPILVASRSIDWSGFSIASVFGWNCE